MSQVNSNIAENNLVPQLLDTAIRLLWAEEDFREKPYLCSEGFPTVGVGQRIGPKGADLSLYQFSLPKPVALKWLEFNVALLIAQVATHPKIESAFANSNLARQTVLISMAYQLGVNGLAGFTNTLAAIADGRWLDAKKHALDSTWARQTPARAQRHAHTLFAGVL